MTSGLFHLLLLIIIANGAPILIRVLLKNRFDTAVDFGQKLPDGHDIFGTSKTWRGVLAAITATPIAGWLLGYALEIGLWVAVYAVIGDLLSSFLKRRLAMEPSSMAFIVDQVPESLLPGLMMMEVFKLDLQSVLLMVLIFIIIELFLSHILYKWGIRKRPY